MPGAPSGFLGKLSTERPVLTTGVLSLAAAVICVIAIRNDAHPETSNVMTRFALGAAAAIAAPAALSAFTPERAWRRGLFLVLAALAGAGASLVAFGALGAGLVSLPRGVTGAGVGLFAFFTALAPLTRNALRLGVLAPVAALIGVIGGIGYFSLQNVLLAPLSAATAAIALAGGVIAGFGVGADFAQHFAKGAGLRAAAAAAGHAALAPAVFCALACASYAGIVSYHDNLGVADAQTVIAAALVALFASISSLVAVAGGLALVRPSEQTAVDENRRRQRFAKMWRPMRRRLPSTSALAASAIAGVIVVIALFEAGIQSLPSLAAFLMMMLAASAVAFVSVRATVLILALLFVASVYAQYLYGALGLALPGLGDRFAALTLAALAFSQLTVSWRNAGDVWRNARDIAQNAMCDGLRRFLAALGAGAASLVVAAFAFDWPAGVEAAGYFAVLSSFGLLLAPVLMVALSARMQHY